MCSRNNILDFLKWFIKEIVYKENNIAMLIILIVNIIIRLSYLFPPWTIDVVDFAPDNIVTECKHIVMGSNHIVMECNHIVTVVTEEEDDVEMEEEDNCAVTGEENDVEMEEKDNCAVTGEENDVETEEEDNCAVTGEENDVETEEDNCIVAGDDVANIVMVTNIVAGTVVEVKDSNIATVEDILKIDIDIVKKKDNAKKKNVLVKDHVIDVFVVAIQEDQIVFFANNHHDWKTS